MICVIKLALHLLLHVFQCEVEGVLPNVTVTLTLPPNGSPLQDILVHPCVTSLDASILTACSVDVNDSSAFSGPYKFPFSPPLELFRLCSYTSQVKLILAIVYILPFKSLESVRFLHFFFKSLLLSKTPFI